MCCVSSSIYRQLRRKPGPWEVEEVCFTWWRKFDENFHTENAFTLQQHIIHTNEKWNMWAGKWVNALNFSGATCLDCLDRFQFLFSHVVVVCLLQAAGRVKMTNLIIYWWLTIALMENFEAFSRLFSFLTLFFVSRRLFDLWRRRKDGKSWLIVKAENDLWYIWRWRWEMMITFLCRTNSLSLSPKQSQYICRDVKLNFDFVFNSPSPSLFGALPLFMTSI